MALTGIKAQKSVITKRLTPHMKTVCKVMPLRKVPNTEDNEQMNRRFDLSVNDSVSYY